MNNAWANFASHHNIEDGEISHADTPRHSF